MNNSSLMQELTSLLSSRFSVSQSTRANYARGEDTYDPVLSQAVVFPETNEEVSGILKSVSYTHLTLPTKRIV